MQLRKPGIRDLLCLLRPYDAVGQSKIRLGSPHDGGYVVLDDFAGIVRAAGCGIGSDISFEHQLADRGAEIDLFDHTVDKLPWQHDRFHFHRVRVGVGTAEPCVSLEGIAAMHKLARGSAILKLDIEGDEWALLARTERESLRRYRQIVCELHGLDKARDPAFLALALAAMKKLTRDFAVVHVHANNHAPMVSFGDVEAPSVLELTFANRAHYPLRSSRQEFPTALDAPNHDGRPDLQLGRFDFRPWLTALFDWR